MTPDELAEEAGEEKAERALARIQSYVADTAQEALNHYREVVPKELLKALTTPESSAAKAAAHVPMPEASSGTIPAALSALLGGAYAGLEGATSAGAASYLMGQLRGRAAYRLAQNPHFVEWATGLTPRSPLAQAALSFTTDVLLQSRDEQEVKDTKQFYDKMLDFIEEFPDTGLGLVSQAEGAKTPSQRRPLPHPGQDRLETGPVRIPR